jgi:hypothetical protein
MLFVEYTVNYLGFVVVVVVVVCGIRGLKSGPHAC